MDRDGIAAIKATAVIVTVLLIGIGSAYWAGVYPAKNNVPDEPPIDYDIKLLSASAHWDESTPGVDFTVVTDKPLGDIEIEFYHVSTYIMPYGFYEMSKMQLIRQDGSNYVHTAHVNIYQDQKYEVIYPYGETTFDYQNIPVSVA